LEIRENGSSREGLLDAYRRIPGYASHLENISNARVMVIGVGALGNELLKNLALFDVGHLFLCDMDTIELANLSHSVLFRAEDDGKQKVDVAAAAIRRLNPRVQVTPFFGSLSEIGLGVWRDVDVVVGCVDNRGSRLLIDRACARAGKDWIDAGLGSLVPGTGRNAAEGILTAAVQVFSPRRGWCFEDYLMTDASLQQAEEEAADARMAFRNWLGCAEIQGALIRADRVPTTPAMASLVGAIQAQEVLRLLSPGVWGDGGLEARRLNINAGEFKMELIGHPRGKARPPVGPVTVAPELSAERTTVAEMVARARQDLGPDAVVELGFQYCPGLRCSVCQQEHRTPFKYGAVDAHCPRCSTKEDPVERMPLSGRILPDHLNGSEPFGDLTLLKLGVPRFEVLTASVYEWDPISGRSVVTGRRHYELAGDAQETLGWPPRSQADLAGKSC
jgi:adenylyltransferase/sulfurtransferase